MKQLDTDLWIADSPLRFVGLEVGTRMTVIRLPDGRLFVHSPISATPELVREVEALGEVAYLIAPNKLHHLFVAEWQTRCPEATTFVAPGLERKRADLSIAGVLTEEAEAGWRETLDQTLIEGFPFANEVVFFHRPTATLILTDLAFNICESSPISTRIAFRTIGSVGRLAPTLLERLLVRDRTAFRRSLERILEWPFERVIVTHGDVSESGGREEMVESYAWALG